MWTRPVSLLAEQKDGWGCVEIDIASSSDLEQIAKYAKSAHDAGVQVTARVACRSPVRSGY